jgi:L-malate glycosyltransferase
MIKEFLESGDIFVHPSGLDALPRSVKEAALMEKPIVASNEGGIPEIIKNGQTGFLCEIDNINQWTERIRFLLDNPDDGRRMGMKAREFVLENFDWSKIAQRFLENLGFSGKKSQKSHQRSQKTFMT